MNPSNEPGGAGRISRVNGLPTCLHPAAPRFLGAAGNPLPMSRPDVPDVPDVPDSAERVQDAGKSVYRSFVDVMLTGVVVIIPLVITLWVLNAAWGFIANALRPVIQVLRYGGLIESVQQLGFVDFLITAGVYQNVVEFLTTITALFILVSLVFLVGLLARIRYGQQLIHYFDAVVGAIPAIGSVYGSFRRMGDAMLESSVDNFREVVLVEYPIEGTYIMGFETAETAVPLKVASGETDMTTLFLPLAPNPVMGGFLAHVPDEHITTVDMSVDEAVSIIITSGIATNSPEGDDYRELTDDELAELGELAGRAPGAGEAEPDSRDGAPGGDGRSGTGDGTDAAGGGPDGGVEDPDSAADGTDSGE
jgi:uncharacterized membrane protein